MPIGWWMATDKRLVDVLGGARVLKRSSKTGTVELRKRVRTGLPYEALESVRAHLHLSVLETAVVLRVPLRTLARRKQEGWLDTDESDRLYRLARIVSQALQVFGTEPKASEWLRRPNRALGNEAPLQLLDTDAGTRLVEDTLGRIEYGLIS